MGMLKKIINGPLWLLVILAILVLINWAASSWHARIDLTNENRFTLSKATKKYCQNWMPRCRLMCF